MNFDTDDNELEPIGWDAIDGALRRIYCDREPKHFGTILPMSLGGNAPLQGISVYKNLAPQPHYHYVTYGFSELYEKETDDPEFSGYGFELTFRLACSPDAPEDPPVWPLNFLQNLARYVFSSGNIFDERHHLPFNGPIAMNEVTDITAGFFFLDPELDVIDTPNGQVKFLQLVGLATDEYELVQKGYFRPIAARVTALTPLAITDIYRVSILDNPAVLAAITSVDPQSQQNQVFGTLAQWREVDGRLEIEIGATVVSQLKTMINSVLQQDKPVIVYGKNTAVLFTVDESLKWGVDDTSLEVTLPPESIIRFGQSLQPIRGEYTISDSPTIVLRVIPVDIKDGAGNIISTIG